MKISVPTKLKKRIIFRLVRRLVICLALYCVLWYGFLYRYPVEYYIESAGGGITAGFFTVLLIVPYFVSGLHKYIRDISYEGTVVSIRRTRELKPLRGGANMYEFFTKEQCIVVRATVKMDNGDVEHRIIRRYDIDDLAQSLCQVGDRVRHVKGAPFTQIYGVGKRHDIDCVWCGGYVDKKLDVCDRCGAPIIPWIDVPMPEDGTELRDVMREEIPEIHASPYRAYEITAPPPEPEVEEIQLSHRPVRSAEEQEFEIGEVTPTPEFGTYKRKVDPFDFTGLLGVSAAALAVLGYISMIATRMLEREADKWIFAVIFAGIIPTAISCYYIRSYPSNHYRNDRGRLPAWIKQACHFILPAEIIRLLLSAVRILMNQFGSLLSPLSHQWWYLYHMIPSQRFDEMENGIFIGEDYAAYFAIAVPATLLRIAILFAAYYFFWRQYEKEREIMFNERNGRR